MGCGCKGSGFTDINTLNCGGVTPSAGAYCSPVTTSCNCGCSPCQCTKSSAGVAVPFYNAAGAIQETHCQQVIQQQFVTSLKVANSFNVPACDANATLTIPGLQQIQIGSYLWSSVYGYFQVVSFDYLSSQVVVTNTCIPPCVSGATYASPGTAVPACSLFDVVDPPCGPDATGQSGIFVAVDFVAQDVGICNNIAVTGVAGLFVGTNVQISSGIYRVAAIIDSTTITICNDGDGVTPGTIVYAKDSNNFYITPITPLSTNACDNTPQPSGSLLTCHNSVQAPLAATALGQIPVVIDVATNEVEFQTVDIPLAECTTLTSCLNLIDGVDTYTIPVADSSIFLIGDLIVIEDPLVSIYRWVVTVIVDPTHITIQKTIPQVGNLEVGCNNPAVCQAPCCDQIRYQLAEGCFPFVTVANIPVKQFSFTVAMDGDPVGYYESAFSSDIFTYVVPTILTPCNFLITAHLSVACWQQMVPGTNPNDVFTLYSEVQAAWDSGQLPTATPNDVGKMVWMLSYVDGGSSYPASTLNPLFGQIAPLDLDKGNAYHQNDITLTTVVPSGTTLVLNGNVKFFMPGNIVLTSFNAAKVQTAGWLTIQKVLGP